MAKDYYAILGIGRDASREEVKKAYKKLAKRYHPDMNEGDPAAAEKFKEINEAAAVLGDEEKRRQYDTLGHEAFTRNGSAGPGPGFSGFEGFDFSGFGAGTDFGDIFDHLGDIFGLGSGFGSRGNRRARRGADLRYDLDITLKEAAFGTSKRIMVKRNETCPDCHGSGGAKVETCRTCNGAGYVRQARRTPFGIFQSTGACPACHGEGQRILEHCGTCHGEGTLPVEKELEVEIPAGVADGSRLRLAGEGEAGQKGAPAGDLYVFLTVKDDEVFERHGDDILLSCPISFFQASFGAEIEVPTLEGKAKLRIPTGTQSGTIFRLRGKGVKHLRGHGRGDQLVTTQVETPKRLTRKQQRLMKELAKEFGEDAEPDKGLLERLGLR